jgi:probable phosphoglycerate mutase
VAVILVRHGETALNAARVLQPADTPLSERGQAQALAVAQRLARQGGIGAILSSDLPRAWHTAHAIGAALTLPVRPSALLHERNFGDLRGRPYDTLGFDPMTMDEAPPGGESAAEFAQRLRAAFDLMLQQHAGQPGDLVVVMHGLAIRTLLAGPLRLGTELLRDLQLANTSLSIFDAAPPHALHLLNCTRHLDDPAPDEARGLSGG